MIPKIIHHIAPEDQNIWHPIWQSCYRSWLKNFPESEYQHVLWNDDDIDNLVKEDYSNYLDLYESFPYHINKIDFSRFCILHKHGGIYADMDVYCYSNFHDELSGYEFVVQALTEKEKVQNCLMGSPPQSKFFELCMKLCTNIGSDEKNRDDFVKGSTGPLYLESVLNVYDGDVEVLPRQYFNDDVQRFVPHHITKHFLTGIWGKESIQFIMESYERSPKNIPFRDFVIFWYMDSMNMSLTDIGLLIDYIF